jgi:two-component system LytT family response regulator
MNSSSPAKVLIVEDQPRVRKDLEVLVRQQAGFMVVGSCGSVKEAIELILSTVPEIVLLDVSLEDGDAFDILDKFPKMPFKVIFLTGSKEHAFRAIKIDAVDYLLKPVDSNELKQALDKAVQATPIPVELLYKALNRSDTQDRIVIRSTEYWQTVVFSDILYCHGDSVYTTFFLTDNRKLVTSKHLKYYEEHLPTNWFLRPHQSYIVNHHYIEGYRHRRDDLILILKGGIEIPVAWRRRHLVITFFNNFF